MKAIEDDSDLTQFKWKVDVCNTGENCWCRVIYVAEEVYYSSESHMKQQETPCIIPDGSVGKKEAEHIVKLHNDWLDNKQKV